MTFQPPSAFFEARQTLALKLKDLNIQGEELSEEVLMSGSQSLHSMG